MNKNKPTSPVDYVLKTLRSEWFYLGLLAFLIIFPHLVGWITGDSPFGARGRPIGQSVFWQSIIIEVFIFAILAMSYNLMFGFTGVISFGHALFFGLGGYAMGIILEFSGLESEMGLLLGFLFAIILSGVVGFLMGLVSLRLKGVYFAIFTLAIAEMAFIYVGRWRFTNAEDGFALRNLPEIFNPTRNRLFFYYFCLIATVATFLFIRRLMNSPTGRVLLAIRENEDRAKAIGFATLRYKLMSITVASMMAAGAGMMLTILNKKVGPEAMSVNFTIEPLIMVIIGGIGTHIGPVIGATGLHLADRILNREFEIGEIVLHVGEYWSFVLGVTFIIVVLIFPQGIVGTYNKWRANRRIRKERRKDSPPRLTRDLCIEFKNFNAKRLRSKDAEFLLYQPLSLCLCDPVLRF